MRFFGREEETLNEKLLREAGLDGSQNTSELQVPVEVPTHASTFGDDVLVVAQAPGVGGSLVTFVALPTGDLIVESEQGDADVSPFADAVEQNLGPPYRAFAKRQNADLWGVVGKPIDVVELHCDAGDEIEVVSLGGRITVTVDGKPSDLRIPELEPSGDSAVRASRIDGDYWETEAHPL